MVPTKLFFIIARLEKQTRSAAHSKTATGRVTYPLKKEPPPLPLPPPEEELLARPCKDEALAPPVGGGAPPQPPLDPDAATATAAPCTDAIRTRSR